MLAHFFAEIHLYFRKMAFNPIMPSIVFIFFTLINQNILHQDFFVFLSQILRGTREIKLSVHDRLIDPISYFSDICHPGFSPYATEYKKAMDKSGI